MLMMSQQNTQQCTQQQVVLNQKPEDVPAEVVAKEREIQVAIAIESGKPREIAEKMVEGRMKKFTGEVSFNWSTICNGSF